MSSVRIMKLYTLVENTEGFHHCIAEHGLSIYIETDKHRMLLDTGQTDALIKNADTLGISLEKVDTVVLSHGHYDHSGGLLSFAAKNHDAVIYMQRKAAEPHYNMDRYIGIDPKILELPHVILLDGDYRIDEELSLFTGIKGRRYFPAGNRRLKMLKDGEKICDDFSHEQCLVIRQEEKQILLSGCAHNGILNILDKYRECYHTLPDYVISGFHMMKRDEAYTAEEIREIRQTAEELKKMDIRFFSGHCTGIPAFEIMKEIMGEQLQAIHSGEEIEWHSDSISHLYRW